MLRRTLAITTLLALTACASLPKQHAAVDALLLGKPQSFATARLGQPHTFGDTKGRLVQYDLRRGVGTALIPNTSQVSGYVGTTPVSASVTSYDSYTYDTYCTLMIQMDASGIIVWTKLDGQPSECRKGLQPLLG